MRIIKSYLVYMSNKCPNSDPDFDKILVSLVGDSKPETRRKIFYSVCIIVRLLLYSAVYYYRDLPFMPIVVGLISLATAIRLLPSIIEPGNQWWSKRWQLFISSILVLVCAGIYLKWLDSRFMGLVLFVSLLVGIIESLFIKFC